MSSMRRLGTIVSIGMSLVGFSGCSSVLMNTPVSKDVDGWSITLSQVKEGPNSYGAETLDSEPGPGQKFIWTLLTVKSLLNQEETFSYETCFLEGKGQSRQPVIVDRHAGENSAADRASPLIRGRSEPDS